MLSEMEHMRARIRLTRQFMRWTQAALAKKAKLSQATIAQIESGRKDPSVGAMLRICKVLSIPTDIIFKKVEF